MDKADTFITGIVVTYQPEEMLCQRLTSHKQQLSRLIVLENSDSGAPTIWLKDWCEAQSSIDYHLHHPNNLAAAQNEGIEKAQAFGAEFVLLLDDDSQMQDGMVAALLNSYHASSPKQPIGLVAPAVLERANPLRRPTHVIAKARQWWFSRKKLVQDKIMDSFTPVSSGSLIPVSVLQDIGAMDASLNIDYVDRDFCLTLLAKGYHTLVTPDAVLWHHYGNTQYHKIGSASIPVRHHDERRRYRIFRNRAECWRRYGRHFPGFVLYDLLAALFDLCRIAMYEPHKKTKINAAIRGLRDGLKRPLDAN